MADEETKREIDKDRLANLKAESENLLQAAKRVQASVASTISSNVQLVNQALVAADTKRWAIVFGGDPSLKGAKYETETVAQRWGIPNTAVYLRQGSYRSVSVVDDRSLAEEILAKAKKQRSDAYLVSMTTWCPTPIERSGYFECQL